MTSSTTVPYYCRLTWPDGTTFDTAHYTVGGEEFLPARSIGTLVNGESVHSPRSDPVSRLSLRLGLVSRVNADPLRRRVGMPLTVRLFDPGRTGAQFPDSPFWYNRAIAATLIAANPEMATPDIAKGQRWNLVIQFKHSDVT